MKVNTQCIDKNEYFNLWIFLSYWYKFINIKFNIMPLSTNIVKIIKNEILRF